MKNIATTTVRFLWPTLGFLFLQALVVIRNLLSDYPFYYWYCDFAPFAFAILFAAGSVQGVKGLLHIGLVGQVFYLSSFVWIQWFGRPLMGFNISLLPDPWYITMTLIMHASTIAALVITRSARPEPISLVYSLLFLSGMYLIVLILADPLTSVSENFNYIRSSQLFSKLPWYSSLWIPLAFFLVVFPTYLVERGLFLLTHPTRHPQPAI